MSRSTWLVLASLLVLGLVTPSRAEAQVVAPLPEWDPRCDWGRDRQYLGGVALYPCDPFKDRFPWLAEASKAGKTTGSLKITANPTHANVHIDNVLVGVVQKFDSWYEHLTLTPGRHVLTLLAVGFETHTQEIVVAAHKTQTVRVTLKNDVTLKKK